MNTMQAYNFAFSKNKEKSFHHKRFKHLCIFCQQKNESHFKILYNSYIPDLYFDKHCPLLKKKIFCLMQATVHCVQYSR